MGILSTPTESPLSSPCRVHGHGGADGRLRSALRAAAVLAACLALLPPLASAARRYDVFESVQFALLALVVPAMVTLGAPLARLEQSTGRGGALGRALSARALARRRHRRLAAALPSLAGYLLALVLWRIPAAVDALQRHPLLLVPEALTFLIVGTLFFSELVASPPFVPHLPPVWRIALAVPAMWTTWLLAYLVGFASGAWFPAYRHGRAAISLIADQQLAAGVLWALSTAVFLPIVFLDLMRFLSDEEDLDLELDRLAHADRRASPPPARSGGVEAGRRRRRGERWRSVPGAPLTGGEPGRSG